MQISDIFSLLGGVALFLFGMTLMGEGLKKVAGNKMELVLYRLSGTPLRGLLLGTGVTAIIQSSSATSVMVVGFVNSGMMKLPNAVAVIEGALIGTSVTGWIIAMSSLGGGGGWASIFSTATLSALVAVIGVILRMFSKKQSRRHVGDILLGFAVLMFGMQSMSGAVAPLKESPAFIGLLTSFSHPLVGMLVGAVITAILQSASAAVGILQALSMTGAITFSVAWPLLLGIAIGSAVPVLLSALGAKTAGRRTALVYLVLEIISSVVFALLYYGLSVFVPLGLNDLVMNPLSIAAANSGFRILSKGLLLPFNKLIVRLVEALVRPSEAERTANAALDRLDERFLAHPPLAVEQSRLTTEDMAALSKANILASLELLSSFSDEGYARVEAAEDRVDEFEDRIGSYLVRLNTHELNTEQNETVSRILHTLTDFERISDHAMNVAETAREMREKKISFSGAAEREVEVLTSAVREILDKAFSAYGKSDAELAYRVEPLEERIDTLCDEMKLHHVDRLQRGECTLEQGFVFHDLLSNLERVADHCSNIAIAVIELQAEVYDAHDYVIRLREKRAHHFDEYYQEYEQRYRV